jgi:hypothetical protein
MAELAELGDADFSCAHFDNVRLARFLAHDLAVFFYTAPAGVCASAFGLTRVKGWRADHQWTQFVPTCGEITALALPGNRVALLIAGGLAVLPGPFYFELPLSSYGRLLDFCLSPDKLVAAVLTERGVVEIDLP